jgi:glucose/arabinose dehydrogenase
MALEDLNLALEEVASGFEQPVFLTAPPGDSRLFVVDQPGRIWVIDDADPAVFLDINGEVLFGGERGLLGLAFHPDFATNRLFYVNYTDGGGDTRVAEYRVTDDPNVAEPGSERVLIEIGQPASNHNGGMIAFGPDGALWVGMGDGGGANDRYGQGQRADTELGSILRLDAAAEAPNVGFATGNEFENPNVWAIGVRNPWRFSFDGNLLYVGDVGQGAIEEIDVTDVRSTGLNFGWPILEGSECFASSDCSREGLLLPVYEYPHSQGCSVTGGYVYRGAAMPELNGHYFFSDFCGGWIRSFKLVEDGIVDFTDWTPKTGNAGNVASFGVDGSGELYVVSTNGTVYRLVRG